MHNQNDDVLSFQKFRLSKCKRIFLCRVFIRKEIYLFDQ